MKARENKEEWYAITTKFKCEKYVTAVLQRKGLEAYVPLLRKTKRYTRKIKTYEIPMISCYAFVKISPADKVSVLEVPYVHNFVRFEGKIVPVPEHEMQMMRRVVGEISEVIAEPRYWMQGDKVEVIAGNLTGIQGTLIVQNGKHEFIIELETLGYQLRMVVDRSVLRRVAHVGALTN
ncbi:MAG TPA: UpxY family transcription antiterminator [Saprospiraceae bacterium]|nr:UpxY family transcription antiterminator [Saprospiraceae bacterium]